MVYIPCEIDVSFAMRKQSRAVNSATEWDATYSIGPAKPEINNHPFAFWLSEARRFTRYRLKSQCRNWESGESTEGIRSRPARSEKRTEEKAIENAFSAASRLPDTNEISRAYRSGELSMCYLLTAPISTEAHPSLSKATLRYRLQDSKFVSDKQNKHVAVCHRHSISLYVSVFIVFFHCRERS